MNSLQEIAGCLKKGKRAVVCGHSMPDGDSVGSVLAMGYLLDALGVQNQVITPDQVPAMYGFLPGVHRLLPVNNLSSDIDLAVILDCTDLNRLGSELGALIGGVPTVINIDHHVSNQEFGTYNYVDSDAAATGEIVFRLLEPAGVSLSLEIAINLYTAIVMDTGSFRFDNTTDRSHEITARLIRTGIDVAQINKNLFEKKDLVNLKLLGYALTRLQTAADGRVAWVTIPHQVMLELGAQDEHADGIINYPRMLDGVEVGMMFREISPNKFKVGFRSQKTVDANKLAGAFGGGGHPRASGCVIDGTIEEVEKKVVDLCIHSLQGDPVRSV